MAERRKVYVVTRGYYSGYKIVGIFLEEEAAKECVAMINGQTPNSYRDDAAIEVYVDGAWDGGEKKLRTVYVATISLNDGEDLGEETHRELALETERTPCWGSSVVREKVYSSSQQVPVAEGRSYVSMEHAHKLAVEARQGYIAKNAGV